MAKENETVHKNKTLNNETKPNVTRRNETRNVTRWNETKHIKTERDET